MTPEPTTKQPWTDPIYDRIRERLGTTERTGYACDRTKAGFRTVISIRGEDKPTFFEGVDSAIDAVLAGQSAALAQKDAQIAALREAVFEMDRQIGSWMPDYAPGQTWLRLLQAAYGQGEPGVPTNADIDADYPAPKVRPHHGCAELAEQRAQGAREERERLRDAVAAMPIMYDPFTAISTVRRARVVELLSDKEALTFRSLPCTECDGVGWTEGGPSLQTPCGRCHGTGEDPEEATNAK